MIFGLLAGGIWVLTDFSTEFAFFASPEPLGLGGIFWAYVLAPSILTAAGALPTHGLGAGWKLALLASAGVSLAVTLVVGLSGFEPEAVAFAVAATPGVLSLVVAVKAGGDAAVIPALVGATALLVLPGVLLTSAEVFAFAAVFVLSAWPVLFGVAGLFLPQDSGEG